MKTDEFDFVDYGMRWEAIWRGDCHCGIGIVFLGACKRRGNYEHSKN